MAELVSERVSAAGFEEVALSGDPAGLQLPHGSQRLEALRPLLDWRALVVPWEVPDETFAVVPGDPADPRRLAAALRPD